MRQHGNRSARRAAALVSFTVTACVLPPDRDLPLATGEVDGAATDRGGTGVGGGAVDMTPTADVVRGDAAAGGDARVVEPPTPDGAVVEPPTPDAAPPVVDAALPGPDAAVLRPDTAPPVVDAALPEPDSAVVVPSDAVVGPMIDAAVVEPPDPDAVVVPPTPDAAVVVPPTPDAAVVLPPDAALPEPDAGPVCGSAGCLTVDEGVIDLRNRVARILGHLAACGPAIDPAAAVDIRLDDARYTVPPGGLRVVDGEIVGCFGADCAEPNSMPVARAVVRALDYWVQPIIINGFETRAPRAEDDRVSTISVGVSAIARAAAINDARCHTGVMATPGVTVLIGEGPIAGGSLVAGAGLMVNNVSIDGFDVLPEDADARLVDAVNEVSAITGVVGSHSDDGRLVLMAPDGRSMDVRVFGPAATSVTGLREPIHGLVAPVHLFSLAPFGVRGAEWGPAAYVRPNDGLSGHEAIVEAPTAGLLRINGVAIREPTPADGPAGSFDPQSSAAARAATINEATDRHGVRALIVQAAVALHPFDQVFDTRVSGSWFTVNGRPIPDFDFVSGDATGAFAAGIESIAPLAGVELRLIGRQPFLVSVDGGNVSVRDDSRTFISGPNDAYGQVFLQSDRPILIDAHTDWTTASATSIAPSDRFRLPSIEFTVDPGTGEYALDVADESIACVTPLDGVDVTLDVGGLRGASFIPTQIVAPGRYAGTWPFCE